MYPSEKAYTLVIAAKTSRAKIARYVSLQSYGTALSQ